MKLRVSLRAPGAHQASNIQVTADATATVHDVAEALAGALGHDDTPANLTLRVNDQLTGHSHVVPAGVALIDSGVQSGTVLELSTEDVGGRGAQREAAAILRVVAGPDQGVEVHLPFGPSSIGRTADNDVQLSDLRVSKTHAQILVGPDKVEIADRNSSNGVLVSGGRVARATLTPSDDVRLGDTIIRVQAIRTRPDWQSTDIAFVRSPRVLARPTETKLELPQAPGAPQRSRFPWLAMLAPLIMGVVMFVFMRNPMSLIFIGLSPIMMAGTWLTARLDAKSQQKQAVAAFEASLAETTQRVAHLHATERAQRLLLYPSVNECVAAVNNQTDLVWSRRPELPEFLQLRLGLGSTRSSITPELNSAEGLPQYLARTRDLAESAVELTGAPIVADLGSVGSLGICGARADSEGVARAVIVQAASLHSPAELVICCLTSAVQRGAWQWLEWLPHTSSPHSPLSVHLAADAATSRGLADQLEELVAARKTEGRDQLVRGPLQDDEQVPAPVVPSVLIVVDEPQVDRARLTRLAELGPDAGVHLVWVAEEKNGLPAACRTFLDLHHQHPAVGQVRVGQHVHEVACEGVDHQTAVAIGRRFAPLVDAGAPIDDESDLPRSVSLVSLLGKQESDSPEAVVERWRENGSLIVRDGRQPQPVDNPVELRAIVGHAGLEPFVIDLRRDGPHALVGGTTGAGKSEFLQAWVLGLAHALSPDRVNYLFVDYKGGSAFAKCVELPHCVGLVTDLNPYLVRRVLTSLRAELKRREHLLNDKGKKDLIDLELSGDPDCPPSLLIVVDEFAALAGEIPEFVDGMVDVAQRGRSLGLHLILATQRPAGVIKDNLRANTNLRIALRMADEQDSTDVLGSPMAAFFSSSIPGRGAAKSGPGRMVTFQSAYPGARTTDEPQAPPIEVEELDFGSGKRWAVPQRTLSRQDVAKDSDRIVETVKRAAANARIPQPRRPWLDELRPIYNLAKLGQRRDTEIVLGVLDNPEHQAQEVEYFHPDDNGNILYIGAGGSGKTTALRSLAIAASITPRSGPVHIYGLDFAGGGLSFLTPLPNVGAIISGEDDERVQRLLRHLSRVIEERSARFAAARASTLSEYRSLADRPAEPRILVLVDGFGSFREQYENLFGGWYAAFTRMLVDGRSVGVHVAMSADRPAAVPTSIGAAFSRRIVLRQADEDAYVMLGVPKDVLGPLSPAGRGMQADKPLELQLAILGEDVATAAQARLIEEMSRAFAQYHSTKPTPIRSLPPLIPATTMPASVRGLPVLGVADVDLQPMGFDPHSMILVTGPSGSGKTSALRWMARSIRNSAAPVELCHLSLRRTPLSSSGEWARSLVGEDRISAELEELKARALRGGDEHWWFALFIEALPDFLGTSLEYPLTDLLQTCRKNGHLVVAEGEMAGWSGGWPLLNEVRNQRCGLILQPEQADGDLLLRTSLPRCKRSEFPVGRGFWVRGGVGTKVQIPLLE